MYKNYTVYFEFFGKKMRHDVYASSQEDAKRKVIERLNFIAVKEKEDEVLQTFKNLFGW